MDLGRFLDGLIPLIEHAERACNVATTNWDSVGSVIKEQLVSPCTEDSDSKYMPSIEDFELERLLGKEMYFYRRLLPLEARDILRNMLAYI